MLLLFIFSCSKTEKPKGENITAETPAAKEQADAEAPDLAEAIARFFLEPAGVNPDKEAFVEDFWRWIFGEAGVPEHIARKVAASALESPAFIMELLIIFHIILLGVRCPRRLERKL